MGVVLVLLIIASIIATGVLYWALTPAMYNLKTDDRWTAVQTQYPAFITARDTYYSMFLVGGPIIVIACSIIYAAKYHQREGVWP